MLSQLSSVRAAGAGGSLTAGQQAQSATATSAATAALADTASSLQQLQMQLQMERQNLLFGRLVDTSSRIGSTGREASHPLDPRLAAAYVSGLAPFGSGSRQATQAASQAAAAPTTSQQAAAAKARKEKEGHSLLDKYGINLIDWLIDWLITARLIDWLIDQLFCCSFDWLIVWSIFWLVDSWMTGLIDWLCSLSACYSELYSITFQADWRENRRSKGKHVGWTRKSFLIYPGTLDRNTEWRFRCVRPCRRKWPGDPSARKSRSLKGVWKKLNP